MGMPTALAAILEPYCNFRTVFYAHEVATVRRIVEEHPGHDTMFYNVMQQAHHDRLYVDEVFGNQHSYFKHALVEAAKYCDRIYAVGDYVADELRFLSAEFESADIDIVYNGVPAYEITRAQKQAAKEKLQQLLSEPPGLQAGLRLHPRDPAGAQQGPVARPAGAARDRKGPAQPGQDRRFRPALHGSLPAAGL